jgi:SatD family protein
MSRAYVALIADAIDSRRLPPAARARLQTDLRAYLPAWNRRHHRSLVARFAITLGDEVQCLLRDARAVWTITHELRHAFPDVDWIVACGRGPITTKLPGADAPLAPADEMDGPCFHDARASLEAAKPERRILTFVGFDDPRLDGLAAYYSALYWSWTNRQRRQANQWRYVSMGDVARPPVLKAARLDPSSYSHLRRRMAWPLVEAGDNMLRAILEKEAT